MSPKIGETISHYRILKRLGKGGMGVVYKAEDTRLKRFVALKFLSAELTEGEAARKRFLREAQTASKLDHPSICSIHEIDETQDGRLFISMAFYEGEALRERLQRGPVPLAEALDIACQVAAGLSKAHDNGVLHRDVSPANIMITKANGVKIIDFGLAKLKDQSKLTRTGRTLGTIVYMSPEQARGDPVDARSDIFSLGVVLYELLANRLPFDGEHETAVLYKILNVDPERLSRFQPEIPDGLQQIIDKALQKEPSSRYQSMLEMREDLLRVAAGLKPARAALPRRYLRVVVPLAAAVVVAVFIWTSPELQGRLKRSLGMEPPPLHLAVIPFENVGGDPTNQAFCDGLVETITSQLTQLEQFHDSLWVVPASEVRVRGVASPSEARKMFGVNLTVTGSVQSTGAGIRVTLNLVDFAKKGRPRLLRGVTVDHPVGGASSFQDETVLRLAQMLNVELLPQEQGVLGAGGTTVSAAYYLYLQGRGYLQRYERRENIDRAIVLFESAISQDSLYALAYAGLGEGYWRRYGDSRDPQWIETARRNCERAIEISGPLSPAHVTLGMIHSGTGEPEKAISEFRLALSLDPGNAGAYRGLADTYRVLGKTAEAESTYLRAIAMKPDYWGGYYDLGRFHWYDGRYEKAADAFRKVVELTPDNMLAYNSLGITLLTLERHAEAREMFEMSVKLEPNQHRAYTNLGALYLIEGRYAQAAEMSKKAVEEGDTSYRAWSNLASAYYWLPGKREESHEAFRRAAELAEEQRRTNPLDAHAIASLAGYYAILAEKGRALALLEEALRIEPNDNRVAYFAGHAYEQLGRRDRALELIGKAVAGGYSKAEIARDPWLRELRKDKRFPHLMGSNGEAAGE
ncbi:MAG: protein kinase [Candidatus Eiseniibacteriota bacterium]|nr:MAG: protein kinase [Candidatus Eisenbacteria bacterium]